jgi:hypothetical protein
MLLGPDANILDRLIIPDARSTRSRSAMEHIETLKASIFCSLSLKIYHTDFVAFLFLGCVAASPRSPD